MTIFFENYGRFSLTMNNANYTGPYTLNEIMDYIQYKEQQGFKNKKAIIWDYDTGEMVMIIETDKEG